jgi:quinol monooxygenase YgiN
MLIRHKVKDYAAWKAVFDGARALRQAGGERSYQILHTEDDSNNLVLLFEWDSLDSARAYLANPDLKAAMDAAGVTEAPEAYFLQECDQGLT